MPRISFVIPALNEEKYLPKLLTSLAEQSCRDFEALVVDGCSRDRTVAVARAFAPRLPALQVILSEKPGLPLQRNLGARAASGEWLAFVDADTILLPYAVERMLRFIDERAPQLFTVWFGPDRGMPGDAIMALLFNLGYEGGLLTGRPFAPGMLSIVRRDAYDLSGGYTEGLTFGEDYDFTQKLSAKGIRLDMLREMLAIMSLRRMRRDGYTRYLLFNLKVTAHILLTGRTIRSTPAYVMGGQAFEAGPRR